MTPAPLFEAPVTAVSQYGHKQPVSADIEAAKTPAGGWTKESLAKLGVPWPPPKGWKKRLEAPVSLPVLPYAGEPPSAPQETSIEAAAAIKPKVGNLQKRVILALYAQPGLSDEGIDRVLGTTETRSARPRRRELMIAGFIQDSGARCLGLGETQVIYWILSEKGEELAREALARELADAPVAFDSPVGSASGPSSASVSEGAGVGNGEREES